MKPWYKSKTIWFNIICAVVPAAAASIDSFRPFMTPTSFASFSLFVTIGNGVLRAITTSGIKFFGDDS